jgi:membrane-bound ClpP family serine protease
MCNSKIRKKAYTLFSLGKFLFEEGVLAILFFWILPQFDTNLPVWLIILLMFLYAFYHLVISLLIGRLEKRPSVVGCEALINSRCQTLTELVPGGYVKVGAEIWRARSLSGNIESGNEVIIDDMKGLTLLVKKLNH